MKYLIPLNNIEKLANPFKQLINEQLAPVLTVEEVQSYYDNGDVFPKKADSEKKWMDIAPDFLASIKLLKHKKMKIKEWWSSIKNIVSFGLYTSEDKKPFLYSINYGLIIFKFPFTFFKILRK